MQVILVILFNPTVTWWSILLLCLRKVDKVKTMTSDVRKDIFSRDYNTKKERMKVRAAKKADSGAP